LSLPVLIPAALVASAVSGVLGMGGGVILLAVMAAVMDPVAVVPVHGVVQLASNLTRAAALARDVSWGIIARYVPLMVAGAWLGIQLYRGAEAPWFQPAVGAFIASSLLWDRFKPRRLLLPPWVFYPAGLGGGFLTVVVGAAGPYLAAFFLRDDLERKQIVATKAVIQTFGHFLKIPAFLSIGFSYREQLGTIVPLLACVVVGTFAGTHVLERMSEGRFRAAFRIVLAGLATRLLLAPWVGA
jgi:uncharacterized membrane protein YfcA